MVIEINFCCLLILGSYWNSFIDSLKKSGKHKTESSAKILFTLLKDINKNLHEYLWHDNEEIMIGIEISINYQEVLESKLEGSDLIYDCFGRLSC